MSNWHDLSGEKKQQMLITTDKLGIPRGTATRIDCHTGEGIPHLAFMAFLFNEKGELYLQKRSNKKSLWDGFWDASIVSHVLPNETVEEATTRRGREELGIDAKFTNLGGFYYFAKFDRNCENEYCHVLVGKSRSQVTYNPVEIDKLRTITFSNLKKEMEKDSHFTPWLKIAMEKFGTQIA